MGEVLALGVACGLGWLGWAWWLERWGRRPLGEGARFDVIIVLGCRVMPGGRPSTAFDRRIRLGVRHFQEGRAPTLLFTGGRGASGDVEAEVARDLAIDLGVPARAIVIERASTSTFTNARHAATVFPGAAQARALVVSDAFHLWRACRVFAEHFAAVRGSGTVHPSWRVRAKGALREVGAIAGYTLRRRWS